MIGFLAALLLRATEDFDLAVQGTDYKCCRTVETNNLAAVFAGDSSYRSPDIAGLRMLEKPSLADLAVSLYRSSQMDFLA